MLKLYYNIINCIATKYVAIFSIESFVVLVMIISFINIKK